MSLLPEERTPPLTDLGKMVTLIYGPPKIGKSTLASTYPKALFIATESGLRFLDVYEIPCTDWLKFRSIVNDLREDDAKEKFSTIVIDTVDLLYRVCEDHVCQTKGIAHPSDEDWGKGWANVRDEFQRGMSYLTGEGYGVVFVTHHKEEEHVYRGRKIVKTVPSFTGMARRIILPLVDFIFYFAPDVDTPEEEGARRLYSRNAVEYEAGSRQAFMPAFIDDPTYDTILDTIKTARAEEERFNNE